MDLFNISFIAWHSVSVSLNWCILLVLCVVVFLLANYGIPYVSQRWHKKYYVNEFQLALGAGITCTISCNTKTQEIAYKIWVELVTRKIGLEIEDDDILEEIYDSWYSAFDVIRELLKEIPVEYLSVSSELIDLTVKVLNQGFRPHLTKWQARYRTWLLKAKENVDKNIAPQELQKQFPHYNDLVKDMKDTNQLMIRFASIMKDIAYRIV